MALKKSLLWPLIALRLAVADAQAPATKTVAVDAAGITCPPALFTSTIIYEATIITYIQSAGQIINVNGGAVTINNAPTTFQTTFQTTTTIVTNIYPTATVTITTDENGNTINPGQNTRSTTTTAAVSNTASGSAGPTVTDSSSQTGTGGDGASSSSIPYIPPGASSLQQ
jgi:hypothetical protein